MVGLAVGTFAIHIVQHITAGLVTYVGSVHELSELFCSVGVPIGAIQTIGPIRYQL